MGRCWISRGSFGRWSEVLVVNGSGHTSTVGAVDTVLEH